MDQLPNLNIEYQLIDFNEVLGSVTAHFIDSQQAIIIEIPLNGDYYIKGIELDNHIMSFKPISRQQKDNRGIVKNVDDIKALITPHNKISESTVYLRRKAIYRRDLAIKSCDWTQLPDVQEVMPEQEKKLWKRFRQELRDITIQPGYPENIEWPQRPYMMGVVIYD
jgi:hypothetical protein